MKGKGEEREGKGIRKGMVVKGKGDGGDGEKTFKISQPTFIIDWAVFIVILNISLQSSWSINISGYELHRS